MGPSAEATTRRQPDDGGQTMSGDRAVRQVLLFAGAVRPTPLLKAAGRNVLDLPLRADLTVGQGWIAAHEALCGALGSQPPMGVLIDRHSPRPASMPTGDAAVFPDDVAFLGTGGVLRAAARTLEGLILVATGGSLLTEPLSEVVQNLLALEADVALYAERDGTPTGIMLVSAEALRAIPGGGYLDFKEQCLPTIASSHRVRVAHAGGGRACLPIRDREQYLEAVMHAHGGVAFAIVEQGAEVSATARLRDAVVLGGSRVGSNAIVARSVLGPGAVVASGQVLTDQSIGAGA